MLPLSAAAGLSWQGFRQLLAEEYSGLEIISIASYRDDVSFSSDTAIAECLVVARKNAVAGQQPFERRFASLNHRPQGFAHAAVVARNIIGLRTPRGIGDGPFGGSPFTIGDQTMGRC